MKQYIVRFYYKGILVCTKLEQAEDMDEAQCNAEFGLVIHYPNVRYDTVEVEEQEVK